MTTYTIPAQNISILRHRVEELNKRAAKLDVPALDFTEVTSYCPIIRDDYGSYRIRTRPVYEVELTGAAIGLPGWRFLGTVEHTAAGNILRAAPEQNIPETYRDASPHCDHCGTDRRRKNTFIVEHWGSGEMKQIGRQCTRDFLGHIDPDRLARFMQYVAELGAEPTDRESGRVENVYPPVEIVANALAAIKMDGGFRPSSFEGSTAGTVRTAFRAYLPKVREKLSKMGFEFPTDEQYAEAARLVEWAQSNDEQSSYIQNLRVAASLEHASGKHIGILASLPKAVQSAEERRLEQERREAEQAERALNSRPAPEGRQEIEGEVLRVSVQESDFGAVDKMIVQADGYRVYVTVPSDLLGTVEAGVRVRFTATLTRSDRDDDFAFGKRPSKAEILEEVPA